MIISFTTQSFTIATAALPAVGGIVTGGGTYGHNQVATLNATPSEGYEFVNWTENGGVVSTDAEYTFTVVTDRTLVANFAIQSFTIATIVSPVEGGIATGAGTFDYNHLATLVASSAEDYEFMNWSECESVVSTNPEYSFIVTANRTLTANFGFVGGISEIETPEVFIFPNPAQDIIYIKTTDISNKKVVIQIHNSTGKSVLLKETVMNRELLPLNIPALTPGLYYVSIQFENRMVSKKIILQ